MTMRKSRLILARCIAAAACASALFASMTASAVQVFRCDIDGHMLYTDTPCAGGSSLQIDPGATDPVAIKQLEQARESLNESADRRLATLQGTPPGWAAAAPQGYGTAAEGSDAGDYG